MDIDTSLMQDIDNFVDIEDCKFCIFKIAEMAKNYINSFSWSGSIQKAYLAEGYNGILCVFFFKINPVKSDIDKNLWVICGDIPSAYIVTDEAPNSTKALEMYIYEMRKWVHAVIDEESIDDLIPVNVEPSKKYADLLTKRLDFIDSEILSP